MNDENNGFVLTSADDSAPPVLVDVRASGRLEGVLFALTLRQTYRNAGITPLEVIYTFPLPHRAVLLGFVSELNGSRAEGQIVARQAAEERYEAALAEGEAPVMLEQSGDGLHTANIGNLNPGDEIVLEVRFAQLLNFEQGRLRLSIPTTIAPRYGDAEQAGLQPQQVPLSSLQAEYPLALSVLVRGSLARAAIECPTHRVVHASSDDGVTLSLSGRAWLDRDVVITVAPQEPQPSLLVRASDAVSSTSPQVLLTAFQLPEAASRGPTALKLLVDCSGSMAGDSIASARIALRGVLSTLTAEDQISLTRFGSKVDHQMAPRRCTAETLVQAAGLVALIEADLGGTEMEAALRSVFGLPVKGSEHGADVLLITDGEIWKTESTIEAARASGQRVFVIGVGSSPAEAVLRGLAEATGGACEFVTPGEALEAAAQRMLHRIRQQPWREVHVEWGVHPAWQTELPKGLFGGDSLVVMAGVEAGASAQPIRLLANDGLGMTLELARCEDSPCSAGDSVSRMAAARRMAALEGESAQRLAVDYQLMSPQTNCILVHQRAEEDKSTAEAELHRVSVMLAAGWGATSVVSGLAGFDLGQVGGANGTVTSRSIDRAAAAIAAMEMPRLSRAESHFDIDALQGAPHTGSRRSEPATLLEIAMHVATLCDLGTPLDALVDEDDGLKLHADVRLALDQVRALGTTESQAMLLLAGWVVTQGKTMGLIQAGKSLEAYLRTVDALLIARSAAAFRLVLGGHAIDAWKRPESRLHRLKASMGLSPG